MALADQHGAPLKTEFGFATGHFSGVTARAPSAPPSDTGAVPLLRLAQPEEQPPDERPALREELARREAECEQLRAEAARITETLQAELAAVRDELASERATNLRRAAELETELQESRASAVTPRAYADERHLLFSLGADGYELLEREGPAPAVDSMVTLPDGKTHRVIRVGPSPFPGSREACAYLDLA